MKKKLLSVLVTVALVLGLGITMAFAADEGAQTPATVATVGDQSYATLQEAVNAADAENPVVLTQDITLTQSITLTEEANVTIEGGKHTVSFAFEGVNSPAVFGSNVTAVPGNVNLTVKDAVLENTSATQQGYGVLTAIDAVNTNITLEGCTLKNLYCGVYINPIKSAENQGTLSITGCTYENTKYGYSVDEITAGACLDAVGVTYENNSGAQQVKEVWNNVVYVNGVASGSNVVDAVANAETGSTIILAPGEYDGDVFFQGKSITVKAMYPAYVDGVKEYEENLAKFYGTFNTSNGSDPNNFKADQKVVIEGIALAGDGLKIGNCNYNAVGNLEVRHCTMEFGANETAANAWNTYNYFVKTNGAKNANYASVIIEDNYISGTPVENVFPIQAWQVENVAIRNNVMELTNAAKHQAIGVSAMATNANVDISGNKVSGAGCAISVTTWYVGGTTDADLGTFAGNISIRNNQLNCVDSQDFKAPIFVGSEGVANHGNFGGIMGVVGNTDNDKPVCAELGWNEGQTKKNVVTLVNDGQVLEQYVGVFEITLPACSKDGYNFLGWLADGETYKADSVVEITKDTSFVAQWEKIVVPDTDTDTDTDTKPSTKPEQPAAQVTVTNNSTVTVTVGNADKVFEPGTVIAVESVTEGKTFEVVKEALKDVVADMKHTAILDITAVLDGKAVQPDGKVQITFDIPKTLSEDNLKLFYVSEEGKVEEISITVDKDARTVTANLEHFSTYVLANVVADNTTGGTVPQTGDAASVAMWVAVLFVSLATLTGVLAYTKKRI